MLICTFRTEQIHLHKETHSAETVIVSTSSREELQLCIVVSMMKDRNIQENIWVNRIKQRRKGRVNRRQRKSRDDDAGI